MRIAFDMDGVMRVSHLPLLRMCGEFENYEAYKLAMLANMPPLLNPMLFALPEDEIYCVTNCMTDFSVETKTRWINFYYGNRVKLLPMKIHTGGWGEAYAIPVAKAKVEVMLEIGIDVYFDDDPMIIREMRTLTDEIKFFKYGAWFEEYVPNG